MVSRIHKFKDDLMEKKCLCCNDNYQKLFYYYEKVFPRMNTWMIEKKFDKT